jgi:hypothetical protein
MRVMKDALIVESKRPTLPENSVSIPNIQYWNLITELYSTHSEFEWYSVSQMELEEKWFGLKEIPIPDEHFDNTRYFEVINKQKYIWAKLKYGI